MYIKLRPAKRYVWTHLWKVFSKWQKEHNSKKEMHSFKRDNVLDMDITDHMKSLWRSTPYTVT